MKTQTIQPTKKLSLAKTTLHLLTPTQTNLPPVPTEGCTPNCGSGLCFVAGAQPAAVLVAGQESQ